MGRGKLMWLHPTTDWVTDSFVSSYHLHTGQLCTSQSPSSGTWLRGLVSLVAMWCKTKQNWPTFPTQYLLIALVIKYGILMSSHPPNPNTHKNHTDQGHGLEKSWQNFIYFPSPSVDFFHLCVYLLAFFLGGGVVVEGGRGDLSQNSDFIKHLLRLQSLSKYSRNSLEFWCCWLGQAASPNLHEPSCLGICTCLLSKGSDSPWNRAGSVKSEIMILVLSGTQGLRKWPRVLLILKSLKDIQQPFSNHETFLFRSS